MTVKQSSTQTFLPFFSRWRPHPNIQNG